MTQSMTIGRKIVLTCGILTAASSACIATIATIIPTLGALIPASVVCTFVGLIAAGFLSRDINGLLRGTVRELNDAACEMALAAGQVASSSQSMAEGSSRQAATIEETSAASAEINSMAQRNTENSRTTAAMVAHSQACFAETNHSLQQMVDAMDGIDASSQKISKIIKAIDEIAFQTNILALNAAVEAARAGEAGMGFAVVADEVRNLAQRCAQAARDTADLIEESIRRSSGGKLKVDEVAEAIRSITGESAKMKILIDEINLGSIEQARGIEQISRSIAQMEQVTQGSAASAEESAGAARRLGEQAKSMQEVVRSLTVVIYGRAKQEIAAGKKPDTEPRQPVPSPQAVRTNSAFSIKSVSTRSQTFPKPVAVPVAPGARDFPMDDDDDFTEF